MDLTGENMRRERKGVEEGKMLRKKGEGRG